MPSELDVASLVVSSLTLLVGTVVSVGVYVLGRRLDFRSRMRRWDELQSQIDQLFVDSCEDLRDVILVNSGRYIRDYDGGNNTNRLGSVMGKSELLNTRHDGVEVICEVVATWLDAHGQRVLHKTSQAAENVLRVGFIPYDYIEHVRLHGDEFRAEPIFYVRYHGPGKSPFRSYTFVEGHGRHIGPSNRLVFDPVWELGQDRPNRVRSWFRFHASMRRGRRLERQIARDSSQRTLGK